MENVTDERMLKEEEEGKQVEGETQVWEKMKEGG